MWEDGILLGTTTSQLTHEDAGFSSIEVVNDHCQLSQLVSTVVPLQSLLKAIQSVQEALEVERSRLQATIQRLHGEDKQEVTS